MKTHDSLPLVFTVAFLASLSGCTKSPAMPDVQTEFRITAVGRVDTFSEARRIGAQINRRIETVHVSEGDRVEAGDVLISLACPNEATAVVLARSQLELAEKELARVRAKPRRSRLESIIGLIEEQRALVEIARKDNERLEALARRNLTAEKDKETQGFKLDAARARLSHLTADYEELRLAATSEAIDVAIAKVDVARSTVERQRSLLSDCAITAPITGDILRVDARAGERSWDYPELVVLGDFSSKKVRVELDERDAGLVRPGDTAAIWISGASTRTDGRVVSVSQVAGRRRAETFDPADRFDRETVEAELAFDTSAETVPSVLDLRVIVGFY